MTPSGFERGLGVPGVLALAMAPAIALGLGRFAYALVLPAMATGLGWTWTQAGWLNGANAAGYMLGALAAAPVMARLGGAATVLSGVALTVLGMAGCAVTGDLAALSALRLLTGAGGALAFVAGGVLAASAAQGQRSGLLLGLFYAGPGFGIAVSGIAMPMWFAQGGGWPGAWLLLAALSVAMAVPLALSLLGRGRWGGGASGAPASAPLLSMAPILLAYAMFGFGYKPSPFGSGGTGCGGRRLRRRLCSCNVHSCRAVGNMTVRSHAPSSRRGFPMTPPVRRIWRPGAGRTASCARAAAAPRAGR
jgi:MFS family permease